MSWWASSIPLAASAIAAPRLAAFDAGWIGKLIADALLAFARLAFARLVVAGLSVRRLVGIARGELRTLGA